MCPVSGVINDVVVVVLFAIPAMALSYPALAENFLGMADVPT